MRKVKRMLSAIALGAGITFMVGCAEVPVSSEPVELEVVQTKEEKSTVKEDFNSNDYTMKYLEYMKGVAEGIIQTTNNLKVLSDAISDNPNIINEDIFKEKVESTLEYFVDVHGYVEDITPPDIFTTYHSLMLESLKEYGNGVKLFADSTANGSAELMGESLEKLVVAINLNNKATEELSKLSN